MFVALFLLWGPMMLAQPANVPDHPRLIWGTGGENQVRQSIGRNAILQDLHRLILLQADGIIQLDPVRRELLGRRLLAVSRTCLKRVLTLSYAFRMTGDLKYLQRAETEMLAVSAFRDWNPSHFLDVAEMTMALAIGYDWLYHGLAPASRQIIGNAILQKGLLPSTEGFGKHDYFLRVTHNWNQVCNAGMVFGALAIYENEPEPAMDIIDRSRESIRLPTEEYEPDGAFPEGPGYWAYGTTFHVMLIDALESAWPDTDLIGIGNGFLKSGSYYLHVHGPTGSFNYSDGQVSDGFQPVVFWFAARTKDSGLVWNQLNILTDMCKGKKLSWPKGHSRRFLPMTLIWGSRLNSLQKQPPEANSWTGSGKNPIGVHRTHWGKDAIFAGIKAGSPGVSHGHMDIGSFIMDARGVRWAIDLGSHNYHKLESQGIQLWDKRPGGERWKIFRYNNRSHNTLVVNGNLQLVQAKGEILQHSGENPGFMYTVVDMSPVYTGQLTSAIRGLAIVDTQVVVIRDAIVNRDSVSRVRWGMMTHDSVAIVDARTAVIHKDGQSLTFKIAQPGQAEVRTYPADPDNDYEDKNPGKCMIGFEMEFNPWERQEWIVLLIPEGTAVPDNLSTEAFWDW